jgi:hypothetical protein
LIKIDQLSKAALLADTERSMCLKIPWVKKIFSVKGMGAFRATFALSAH